jgi:membrane protein
MILQYPLAFGLVVLALWTIYYILPDFPQHRSQILVGAIVAAVLWVVATVLFRLYVTHMTNGNATYGAIGGVLLLLSWMYYAMVVVLAGGELNAELAKGTAEVAAPPKTQYDRKVAAAQSERAAEDRHVSRQEEAKEAAKGAKRDAVARDGGAGGKGGPAGKAGRE